MPEYHWAFGAIGELLAKGIIDGVPDGAFTSDRGVTRCGMAVIVARVLERIDAIEAHSPAALVPRPEVTRADIQIIQRLVHEFGAELAALGVPVTAVEDQLTALERALDKELVKDTSKSKIKVMSVVESQVDLLSPPAAETKYKLMLTGAVAPTATAVTLLSMKDTAFPAVPTFDYAYVDLHNTFGANWQIGLAPFTLGLIGLLFDLDPTGGHVRADLSVRGLDVTAAVVREVAWLVGGPDTFLALRAGTRGGAVVAGVSYLGELTSQTGAWSHGWAADLSFGIRPGVSLKGEYAWFTPAGGAAATAYEASLKFDLTKLLGLQALSPTVKLAHRDADPAFRAAPPTHTVGASWRGWSTELSLTFSPSLAADFTFESGTRISSGAERNGLGVEVVCTISPNTEFTLGYSHVTLAGVEDENSLEANLSYNW